MAQEKVDRAQRIPKNAVPGVAELLSNSTLYVAEVAPDTAGENVAPVECGSIDEEAATFKPSLHFQVKKLDNLGAENPDEISETITMNYGVQPKEIMNDFNAENLAVKAKTNEGERVLLDQQLAYLALEDLQERLKDQKFAQLFDNNRDAVIQSIAEEIERVQSMLKDIEFEKMSDD